MKYPLKLSDQIKFLKENKDFFLTFGPYTEPYEDKLVAKIVEEVKSGEVPLWGVANRIRKYFKKVQVEAAYIFSVKYMEDHHILGGCSESALLTSAVFRKLGYPTAILVTIVVDSVFLDPTKDRVIENHVLNLVYKNNAWWLYDTNMVIKTPTRFVFQRLFHTGLLPAMIIRDPADVGIKSRADEYFYALHNLKDILLLDLQKDIVDQNKLLMYKTYKFDQEEA